MIGVFRATWTKLGRKSVSLGAAAAIALFGAMSVVVTFTTARRAGGSRLWDPPLTVGQMGRAELPAELAGRSVMVLGAVVVTIAAAITAAEYSTGAIRTQLVRRPRRWDWWAGTVLAQACFTALLSLWSLVVVVSTAFVLAGVYGVPTDQWLSADAAVELLSAGGGVTMCLLGLTVLGSALAIVLRSAIAAIGAGLVWMLFEGLLVGLWPTLGGFLPGQLLSAIATGGNETVDFQWALAAGIAFTTVLGVAAGAVFTRRDITV